MLQTIGLMIYVYCAARLLQVMIELKGVSEGARGFHVLLSIGGVIVLTLLAFSLMMTKIPNMP